MTQIRKWIFVALCMLVIGSGTTANVLAENLPTGFLIGDHDGIHVTRDGAYFIDAVDLRPGDVITKKLTIRNTERDLPFRLTMSAQPLFATGPVDLLKRVDLEIRLDGKLIYEGIIQGDEGADMVNNMLELGTYAYGDSKTMDIRLTVDENMPQYEQKSEAEIKWNFYAVKDTAADPPKTGESISVIIAIIVLILLNFTTLFFLLKSKENEYRKP